MHNWKIEDDYELAHSSDGVDLECWNVTDGARSFRCSTKADAEWLLATLAFHKRELEEAFNEGYGCGANAMTP